MKLLLAFISIFITFVKSQSESEGSEESTECTLALPVIDAGSLKFYGSWCVASTSVQISVDSSCSTMTLTLMSTSGDNYFSVGFGGDYTLAKEYNMNGYAIVTVGDTDSDVYESTLEAGVEPEAQSSQDLVCTVSVDSGIRTAVCTRNYDTGDSADDLTFTIGANSMIYATGTIDSGILVPHGVFETDRGIDTITLDGDACTGSSSANTIYCGFAFVCTFIMLLLKM